MKQNICVVIFLLLSTICKAQTFIYPQNDSILTEYNDGKFWAYLNKNDFVVGLSCFEEKDDYGKYYHLDIFIKNLSETPIVFQPDSVHSNLLTKKDDTLKLEVYTNEEYQLLNRFFDMYTKEIYDMDYAMELRYRDLCKSELRKRKADESGDIQEIAKAEDSLRKNLALLKLDKFSDNKKSDIEKHIERMAWMIENTKPAECRDLDKYKDFSNFNIKWDEIMRCVKNLVAGTREYPNIPKDES